MFDFQALSYDHEATQTWLAYDMPAKFSLAWPPSQPSMNVREDTQPLVPKSVLDRDRGPSLGISQPLNPQRMQMRVEDSTKGTAYDFPDRSTWSSTFSLFGLLILGLVLAVGHHVVFTFLDGKPISSYSQTWVYRLSNGDALAVKMCWILVVGIAFRQILWYSFRETTSRLDLWTSCSARK